MNSADNSEIIFRSMLHNGNRVKDGLEDPDNSFVKMVVPSARIRRKAMNSFVYEPLEENTIDIVVVKSLIAEYKDC